MNADKLNDALFSLEQAGLRCRCIVRTVDCYEEAKYGVLKTAARLAKLLDEEIEVIKKEESCHTSTNG